MIWGLMAVVILLIAVSLFYVISRIEAESLEPIRPVNTQGNHRMCKNTSNRACCGLITFEAIRDNYSIYPHAQPAREMRHVHFQEEVLSEHEDHFAAKGGKEIWIVSSNLATEINDGATEMVAINLKEGIIYRDFYSRTDSNGDENIFAEENKKLMQKKYNHDVNLHFVAYDEPKDGVGGYLFDMFVIVIYIYANMDKRDAYFSIRSSNDQEQPIYFKMPWCMEKRYYKLLDELSGSKMAKA